ncbi:conserved hypothetical protein [Mesorhizobium prunaredense]|uniref:Uncharacterized protein n=1 Tax=Mesorhizobium prunaredense TaxID=1631249 RepID=A0A1R3V0V7_9HYPH|nr:conserved hypothetical protein [Mesorhizobium prunaredense]
MLKPLNGDVPDAKKGGHSGCSRLQKPLPFGTMFETEPVRRLSRLGKAPSGILAAARVLAPMVLNAGARERLHCTGKPDQLVVHRNVSLRLLERSHGQS